MAKFPKPTTPEPGRFSIRLPRPLWIGVAVMLFLAEAGFGDPADVVAPKKIRLPVQLFKPAVNAATARAQFTSTIKLLDAVATRELFDNCLRQKIAIVDQVCQQTDSQKQKLQLAGRGDIKMGFDRAAEIETQFQLVQNDVDKVNELCQEALLIRRGLIVLSDDDSLFVKVLQTNLTADQSARYQPLGNLFRLGGRARMYDGRSCEGLMIILDGTGFADGDFMHLKGLPDLHSLSLRATHLTDVGLSHLKGLTTLEQLYLNDTQVTDASLAQIEGLTNLVCISLDNTRVTDAGLAHLERLTRLKMLCLCNTQLTDAGLVHLEGLTELKTLQIGRTALTDSGLAHLKRLSNLQFLSVDNTQVTNAGVADLQRVVPRLRIHR